MESTIRHKATPRTEALVRRLVELTHEIDDQQLAVASPEARAEWAKVCGRAPTAAEIRSGFVCLSEEELELIIGKVLRFKAILARLSARAERSPPSHEQPSGPPPYRHPPAERQVDRDHERSARAMSSVTAASAFAHDAASAS